MKLFLKILSVTIGPLLLFAAWNHAIGKIPTSYLLKKAAVESRGQDIQVFNTGTSREFDGINPALFSVPGLNLANNSQDIYYDMEMMKWAVPRLPQLKLIIYSIFTNTLIRDINDLARTTLYYRIYDSPAKDSGPFDFIRYQYSRVYSPMQAFTGVFRHVDINLTSTIEKTGWTNHRGLEQRLNPDAEKEIAQLNSNQLLMPEYQSIIAENTQRLEKVIGDLTARNIKVVFVTVPTHKSYHDNLNPAGYQKMQEIVGAVVERNHLSYYNFIKDDRFKDEDFIDGSHLNVRGAEKFSKILDQEVIRKNL